MPTSAGERVRVPARWEQGAAQAGVDAVGGVADDRLAHLALRQLLAPEVLKAGELAQLDLQEGEALVDLEGVGELFADEDGRLVEASPQEDVALRLGRAVGGRRDRSSVGAA